MAENLLISFVFRLRKMCNAREDNGYMTQKVKKKKSRVVIETFGNLNNAK